MPDAAGAIIFARSLGAAHPNTQTVRNNYTALPHQDGRSSEQIREKRERLWGVSFGDAFVAKRCTDQILARSLACADYRIRHAETDGENCRNEFSLCSSRLCVYLATAQRAGRLAVITQKVTRE